MRPKTGRAIAVALGVKVSAILPKATEPLASDDWPTAVGNARHLREYARELMDRSLKAWRESIDRSDFNASLDHLNGIGRLLHAAHQSEKALWSAGADDASGAPTTDEYMEELQAASRFYGELRGRVEAAGLRVGPDDRVKDLAA